MINELEAYIQSLLNEGKSPDSIKQTLLSAGWPERDIDLAISKFSSAGDASHLPAPPTPPNKKTHNIVGIVVSFFSLTLLYVVASSLGTLFFQIIDNYFFDALVGSSYTSTDSFRARTVNYSIASLIVSFPIYIWSLMFWFRGFARNPHETESRLTKWFTYIVLVSAAGTIVGDLIGIIFRFLQGELGVRFAFKALTILVIATLTFIFYFLERRKIQFKKDVPSIAFKTIGSIIGVIVILAVVLGFLAVGSPANQRLRRFDIERASDLRRISLGVGTSFSRIGRLPISLDEARNSTSGSRYGYNVPDTADPETEEAYQYKVISSNEYELCATFSLSTLDSKSSTYGGSDIWVRHDSGRVCKIQTVVKYIPL